MRPLLSLALLLAAASTSAQPVRPATPSLVVHVIDAEGNPAPYTPGQQILSDQTPWQAHLDQEPLAEVDFYTYAGREDLATQYRSRHRNRNLAYFAGGAGVMGGIILLLSSPRGQDSVPPEAMLGMGMAAAGGFVLRTTFRPVQRVVGAEEAMRIAEDHNARRQEVPGAGL